MKKLLVICLLTLAMPITSEILEFKNGINGFDGIRDGFGKTIYSFNAVYKSWYNVSYPNSGKLQMSWLKS